MDDFEDDKETKKPGLAYYARCNISELTRTVEVKGGALSSVRHGKVPGSGGGSLCVTRQRRKARRELM